MGGSRSHYFTALQHNFAWVKWLTCCMCWAHAGATSAHGAGIKVKQLFPCEIFDNVCTKRFKRCLGEVRHCLHCALWTFAIFQIHVQRRGEHVAQHGDWQNDEEGNKGKYVCYPPHLMQGIERRF